MKISYFTLLSILVIAGCKEVNISTTINDDGSINRTYTTVTDYHKKTNIKTGKASTDKYPKPSDIYLPVDSTWKKTVQYDSAENIQLTHFSKQFRNAAVIQDLYNNNNFILKNLSPRINLKKRFRWFYTYHHYSEYFNPVFRGLPANDFFTKRELNTLKTNKLIKDNLLRDKVELWINTAIVNEIGLLIDEATGKSLNHARWKKKVIDIMIESDKTSTPLSMKNDTLNRGLNDFEDIVPMVEKALNIEITDRQASKILTTLEEKMSIYMHLSTDKLIFEVNMPGKIIETSSDSITNKTIYWKGSLYMVGEPLEMVAVSKKANVGIWALTALIVVFFGLVLIRKQKKTEVRG